MCMLFPGVAKEEGGRSRIALREAEVVQEVPI